MIITQTPFRISFLGGGTDYQGFFQEHGGAVLSTTFDKYCYVHVRHLPPFFEYRNSLSYRKIEHTDTADEFEHPLVRACMKSLDMHDLSIVYDADLPARSGLGSSSSFAVGLLSAFYALKGKYADKGRLAKEAIFVERELCNESGGWQDQIAVSYGGLNKITFSNAGFNVAPVVISSDRKSDLNRHLMLFFTGLSRISSEISSEQVKTIKLKNVELLEMLRLVGEGERILTGKGDVKEFGRLLDYAWAIKRGLTDKISTDTINGLYDRAKKSGAIGGKLLGAGGGGFLLLFVPQERQADVKSALSDLLYVPFAFEDVGTRVIHYSPEEYND